jgi:hypothetical protein
LLDLALNFDLPSALVIDFMVFTLCAVLLLRYGQLAHSHPAVIYLAFHLLVVPSRLLAVMAGADTLFSQWGFIFEPVTEGELARAAMIYDLALLIMTSAWIRASVMDKKKKAQSRPNSPRPVTLSLRHIWTVVAVAFPIGVVGLAFLGSVPGIEKPQVDLGEWQESSWLGITVSWTGLALLALIYWYGFRWWVMAPMGVNLLIMSLQGYHRFRVIVPIILMIQIYLDRRQRKWPPLRVMAIIVCVLVLFFPMKTIGKMAQEGESYVDITQSSQVMIKDAISGQHGDQTVLDQLASTLTLVDRADKHFYGSPYLALLTSPVPRQWWPEKPTLSEHLFELSIPSRPMAEMGMVPTILGDFYLNFGFIGILILSYLTAYFLARVYFRAYESNYFSVLRFVYLLIACNLITIYRDGLMSLFIFTMVNMMPLAIIVILHWISPARSKKENMQLHSLPLYPR